MKTWDDYQAAMAPIKRYAVGVTEHAEMLYRNRDRLVFISEDPNTDFYAYRCEIQGEPEFKMEGTDTRPCTWLKTWLEELDRQDEAEINAWRAMRWITEANSHLVAGEVPREPEVYFWDHCFARADAERGMRLP